MRGEASRIADRVSRDSLAPKLKATGEDAWRVGNELFAVTDLLDHNVQVERALTDPARPAADKTTMVHTLLEGKAHPMTVEILDDLVQRRWSKPHDIANAVEDFGVDAMMYYADATGTTMKVSVELAELHSALLNMPVVRTRLYDEHSSAEARVALLHNVLSGNEISKVTMRLAEPATANPRHRRYLATIQWLINKLSRHMGESMVTVTTAAPLSGEQIDRLTKIYTKRTGHAVHINSVVDPTVLGGMRVQIGHEVNDNTVIAQLNKLKRSVQVTA